MLKPLPATLRQLSAADAAVFGVFGVFAQDRLVCDASWVMSLSTDASAAGLSLFGKTKMLGRCVGSDDMRGIGEKCLDAADARTENSTRVQIWDCPGVPAQRWSIVR